MKDKINTLLDMLQGEESAVFSICRTEPYGMIGKHRIELNLTDWYKPIFGDSWDECIDNAIVFISNKDKKKEN